MGHRATTEELVRERAALTPAGEKALERFMHAKMATCPHCGAAPLFPCVTTSPFVMCETTGEVRPKTSNTGKPRSYFHQARYNVR